jgi:O-Antigen ligase
MKSMALLPLVVLVLLLPFEPMEPLARVLGFEMSYLEVFALVLMAASGAVSLRDRPARSRPLPLAGHAVAFLVICVLSAVLADGSSVLPLKFTLRLTAATAVFLLTSRALGLAPRFEWLLFAFAVAGTVTAAVALLEAGGFSPIASWVAPFREHAFEVGGQARVAATFSYPNTAGGFLVLTLPPTLFFLVREEASGSTRALSWIAALVMFSALLLTYSRGALVGAISATLSFWIVVRRKSSFSLPALHGAFVLVVAVLFFVEPSYRWRTSSEGDRSWYRARIEPRSDELELRPGELASTSVAVSNVGKLTWDSTAVKPFHLSYRWFRLDPRGTLAPVPIEGERTALSCRLAPGEELRVQATVRAPREPGCYVLIWDMVQEHTTWFSDKVGLGAPVSVFVGARAEAVPCPKETGVSIAEQAWRPGRRELWQIALGLFVSHPLLGVGPDNFRWLYGPAAGHRVWDTRVFSNSLYLELLATVGLTGFTAFVLFVAGALIGVLRQARTGSIAAAAIAASLLGFVVHGFVDYLLALTPIYLAIFILLGASSASIAREDSP